MKLFLVLSMMLTAVSAQQSKIDGLDRLLAEYFEVKNALVLANPGLASEKAEKLKLLIYDFDIANLKAGTQKAFQEKKGSLLKQIESIEKGKEVEKQRTQLAELTETLWSIIEDSEDVGITVYYDYCPMKKSWWLSEVAVIKNPYYGSKMLSCGKVENKIN